MPALTTDTTGFTADSTLLTADQTWSTECVLVGNATKRDGACAIRSAGGMAVLDETYYFLVRAPTKDTAYLDVLNCPGLPLVNYTPSPSGIGICRSKSATRNVINPLFWDVVCEFSSEVDENQSGSNPTEDPTAWIPIYETKFERLQEIVTKDLADTAIANSAGQPFENGMTISRFIPVWEFFQFESSSITDEQILERNETLNASTFRGRAPQTLMLTINSSVIGFYYGVRVRLTQYSLRYNIRKWTHKRLDLGTVYKDGTNHKPYKDADGNVILGGLNGSGGKVTVGQPPAVREFEMYEELNFNAFIRVPV